jgi:asparagine synthase (glutamine-hydrolysing)
MGSRRRAGRYDRPVCGIAGILRVYWPGAEVVGAPAPEVSIPEAWLDLLDASVRHRGPDGQGRFRQRVVRTDGAVVDVALAHRRLSVIDHGGGGQPMVGGPELRVGLEPDRAPLEEHGAGLPLLFGPAAPDAAAPEGPHHYSAARPPACPHCTESATLAVVFNGCIYNHRDLRRELEGAGHVFVSDHSDTEVWLHGWRHWGATVFERVEGMFAVALWDAGRGEVIIARDMFGEKPLYVARNQAADLYAWGSAPLGISDVIEAAEGVEPAPDPVEVARWLRFGCGQHAPLGQVGQPGVGTSFAIPVAGERREPLHRRALKLPLGARMRRRLPSLGPGPALFKRVEDLLELSVQRRLEADVPLGCFLSGGVDSSLVALMAARHVERLTTICVRMPDARYDESPYAEHVAAHIGSDHHTVDASASPAEDMQTLICSLGLPFGDSSLLPTYWACLAAAGSVKVALSGDGGDELFLGYQRYQAAQWSNGGGGAIAALAGVLAGVTPSRHPMSLASKLRRLLRAHAAPAEGYWELLAIFQRPDLRRLLPRVKPPAADGEAEDSIAARELELRTHLPDDMLRKVDHASLAAGIEVRCPMLDGELARFALGLPLDALTPGGRRKGLLRAVARRHLPREVIDRPKQGFAIPVGEWFRSDYGRMRQLLRDHLEGPEPFGPDNLGLNDLIDMLHVRRVLREHDDAGEGSLWPWRGRDHAQRLYMLLALSIWGKWVGR